VNQVLAYISGILTPIAFGLGAGLTIQVWRLKNPICLVFALLLLSYQTRNLISAVTLPIFNEGLVRPTGLLIWSNIGRVIEISGTSIGILYFAGKIQLAGLMNHVLEPEELHATPRAPVSGDLPPDFWRRTFGEVIRENIKDDFLK
jgi:hypothetical protein